MGVRVRVSYPAPCTPLFFCPLSPWPLLPPCLRLRRLPQLSPMSTMLPVMLPKLMSMRRSLLWKLLPKKRSPLSLTYTRRLLLKPMFTMPPVMIAEEYVHVEPVVPAVAPVVAPAVTYAAYPYASVYAGHAVAYPYAVYHTGCVNNVGSVVPCA